MKCNNCPYGVQNEQGIWDCINKEGECVEDYTSYENDFFDNTDGMTIDEDGNWDWEADYERTLGGGGCR